MQRIPITVPRHLGPAQNQIQALSVYPECYLWEPQLHSGQTHDLPPFPNWSWKETKLFPWPNCVGWVWLEDPEAAFKFPVPQGQESCCCVILYLSACTRSLPE